MSNYHVLLTSDKEHYADVVFHISVPDENNGVGVNLRTALSQYISGNTVVSKVPWLQDDFSAEYTAIQNGSVYEYSDRVDFAATLTVPQKRDVIDSKYTSLQSNIPDVIRSRFKFWGLNRDVT